MQKKILLQEGEHFKIYLKNLKTSITKGTIIPMIEKNGNIGRYIEKLLIQDNYNIQNGPGPDLKIGIEIKTRKDDADSGVSIGSVSEKTLFTTPYKNSHISRKCQILFLFSYKENHITKTSEITNVELLDLRDVDIQARLEKAYDEGRNMIINNKNKNLKDFVSTCEYGYFEKNKDNSYKFRISKGAFKKIRNIANCSIDSSIMQWGKPILNDKVQKIIDNSICGMDPSLMEW